MRIILIFLLLSITLHVRCQENEKQRVGQTIDNMQYFLSFSDTSNTRIDSLLHIFTADARLTANFGAKSITFTVPQFIDNIRNGNQSGISSAVERDLSRKIDVFGQIAHVWDTYELTIVGKKGKSVRRGINSIQLLKQDGRWLIYSLIWDRESDALKIPDKYLRSQM